MRALGWVPAIVLATTSCASGGGPETLGPPISWTPGHYTLEASVPTADGGSEELTADLRIRADGSMSLLSPIGSCRLPTERELERDEVRRQRTFDCGDAVYVVRPTVDRVRGEVRARVTEQYRVVVPCPPGQAGPCYEPRTRRVIRSAQLSVFVLD